MLILKHVFFVLFITYCIKCFQFCVLNSFLLYELMLYFFVILDPLNLTVFLRHYFIQKSKLNWKWVFLFFIMTINIEQWCIAVGTYRKSVIFIKRTRSYSFSCESYLYLLLSLVCVIPLYLYCLIRSNLDLLSFLIRSKINNLTEFCLSLQFLWIFTLPLGYYNMVI